MALRHRLCSTHVTPPSTRRRVIGWFKRQGFLDAHAAADMLAWENSGFSIDATVRITLLDRDVPSYFQSLEHLLRYCARPPFALHRLSVIRDADGGIARICYVMPTHKAVTWVGPGRKRKSMQPERLRADTRKSPLRGGAGPIQGAAFRAGAASGCGSHPFTSRSSVGQRWRKGH